MADGPRFPQFHVGVDENGLGPRLGPMVVTAVLARVTDDGAKIAARAPRGALSKRLGDSKQLVSHGDVALGEAWARAVVERRELALGTEAPPRTPSALLHAISADGRDVLRALCPAHVEAQCWSPFPPNETNETHEPNETEAFEATAEQVRTASSDLDRLARKGVEIVTVRSVILCARRMNDALASGRNKFVTDLHAMERLVLELRALAGEPVKAVCGKVGGFTMYGPAFGPLAGRLHNVIEESRARSAYAFPGLGEISFVRDSDASDLCVALASMVGKWVREAMMTRIVGHYRAAIPDLPNASGYHDPVTARFVDATRLLRRERNVPDLCFER